MNNLLTDKKLCLTSFPRSDKNRQLEEEPVCMSRALDTLARLLDDSDWLLGGGVAIPLTLGGYYRRHSDLDILADFDSLDPLYRTMRKAGYRLYTRKSINHGNRGWVVLAETKPGGHLMKWHPRALCFINPEMFRQHTSLGKLDFYPYREQAGEIHSCDGKWHLDRQVPLEGKTIRTLSGALITCLDLRHVRRMKHRRGGYKHRLDLCAIDEGLEAARDRRRLWLGGQRRAGDPVSSPAIASPSSKRTRSDSSL